MALDTIRMGVVNNSGCGLCALIIIASVYISYMLDTPLIIIPPLSGFIIRAAKWNEDSIIMGGATQKCKRITQIKDSSSASC